MGFNKLRNLTEGMLRGLGKLQYLYLQANLIESVSPNTFWECVNIENIDLSMNRYRHGSMCESMCVIRVHRILRKRGK